MRRTKINQKGRCRNFSTPEEIQDQMAKIDLKDTVPAAEKASSSSDEDESNPKPVSAIANLIAIENPNRNPPPANPYGKVELSRREREMIDKQAARVRYQKLTAAGKTVQAKADLERLAAIRAKREEEAAKRREEAKAKEELAKMRLQASNRKLDATGTASSLK